MFDNTHGALAIVVANEHGNRVECVEEKMRIELCLQRCETSAGELFGESCDLDLALACVDEVTRRMLDADNAQINCDTERQRDEDPTQPFNTDSQPELCGSVLHRLVIKLRREESHKHHSQHLTAGGPGDA